MTDTTTNVVPATGLLRVSGTPLSELIARHGAGDTALGHCLLRAAAQAQGDDRERVAAFNAAPLRGDTP